MKDGIRCRLGASVLAGLACLGTSAVAQVKGDLSELGCLDVTQAPYAADPTGQRDSTEAIQRAVNDARDTWRVCFFPEGTYLISDTISCEQQVARLERPRRTDGRAQHYWDKPNRIVMVGSTRGKRPVLRLAPGAKGFDDPQRPKRLVWIWAQTRDDTPGREEPEWGKEQPNISFGHVFRGIDIDIRGHAGAIGIRHSGSQGSTLQDCRVLAEGAYAGLSNCCGQGGGTYNVEVVGARYGICIDRNSRFPLLVACTFRGQTEACVTYTMPSQMPTLMVGCLLQPKGNVAVDLRPHAPHEGVSLVDCMVEMPGEGTICASSGPANVFLENTVVRGVRAVRTEGRTVPHPGEWLRIAEYASSRENGVLLVNGKQETRERVSWQEADIAPSYGEIHARHWQRLPSFEDEGVVSIKDFGACGDGKADDTDAFRKAVAAADTIFLPNGKYSLAGTIELRPKTRLFGLSATFCAIGEVATQGRAWQQASGSGAFRLVTADAPDACAEVHFLSVRGLLDWRSGGGSSVLAPTVLAFSGTAGGRFYGVMARGGQFVLEGIRHPMAFYAFNVERKGKNPQSLIRDCRQVRIYYFKVEAGTVNRPNAGDANTPCRIADSRDVRVYCMYGVVRGLEDRPMLEVADCADILVAQLKTFSPQGFPHLVETLGERRCVVPSSATCALFVREDGP